MNRELPQHNLRRGDTILTYGPMNEGFCDAWFKGRYYPEFDVSFAKYPSGGGYGGSRCAATYIDLGKRFRWIQVKLKSGRTGWVNAVEAEFEGGCCSL